MSRKVLSLTFRKKSIFQHCYNKSLVRTLSIRKKLSYIFPLTKKSIYGPIPKELREHDHIFLSLPVQNNSLKHTTYLMRARKPLYMIPVRSMKSITQASNILKNKAFWQESGLGEIVDGLFN